MFEAISPGIGKDCWTQLDALECVGSICKEQPLRNRDYSTNDHLKDVFILKLGLATGAGLNISSRYWEVQYRR